jgi:aquaporin related protein
MALKNILPLHKKDASPSSHKPKTLPKDSAPAGHPTRSGFLPNRWRNELVAAAAEFAGTFMFLFFAFGGTSVANTAATYSNRTTSGQDNNSITQAPDTSVLLYISLIFGFSLMVNVWVFFRVSGGLFNPAVSQPDIAKPYGK